MVKELKFSGGGSQKNPTQTSDNLRNDDNAELVIGLCEGPIVGLKEGYKSFYVADTPLQDSDGNDNFDECVLDILPGDESQDESIKYTLGGTASGTNVGLEIKKPGVDNAIVRYTSSANIDYIDVRIGISSLLSSDDKGGTYNATGKFRIDWRNEAIETNWHSTEVLSVTGKTTSAYSKDYRLTVARDPVEGHNFAIRVVRISQESSNSSTGYFFNMYFSQFETVDATVREFKNTAIAHLTIKTSDQVTSLPQTYGIYKLLKIKVPSNYDPETHTYDGFWDGTFKIAWTDNPAWCLYDLIVNDRYGVNAYYPVTPDKWDFYEAGKYCDEKVSDGKGGYEPRYTFNYLITESQSGPDMLNYIASTFNAIIYEDSMGLVRLYYEDNERDAIQIYNPTNITSDGFNYSFVEPSNRYNDYTVTFINPLLDWKEDRRRVTEPFGSEDIDKYGRITYNFNAIGCTKESEAIRKTRFKLITSLKENMSVTFNTNRSAMNVNLFDTILISDPDMNYAQSGRIKSVSSNRLTVYLRDPVFLEQQGSYEFMIQTSYGVFRCNVVAKEFGRVTELRLDNQLPKNIDEKAVFTLSGKDSYGSPKPFRVTSITESQGDPDKISITACEIYRTKQTVADTGVVLEEEMYSSRKNYTSVPQILNATFTEYYDRARGENALLIGVELDWEKYPYYTGSFKVYSRLKDSEEGFVEREVIDGNTVFSHPAGDYEFKILPATTLGLYPALSRAPIFDFKVREVAADNPPSVSNFIAEGNINNIKLSWDVVEEADHYEIRLGDDWDTGDVIAQTLFDNEFYYTDVFDDNEYKFMIKAVNYAGLYSDFASVAYGSITAPQDVKKFYATPNLDSLRFDWVAENENAVAYEVRMGLSWESGITLFTAYGDNNTILNPKQSDEVRFFIKAISSKGVYSYNAITTTVIQNLKQNRNVVLKFDNGEGTASYYEKSESSQVKSYDPWYGVTHGLIPYEDTNIRVMKDNYYNADHFFPINLPDVTSARNWYDVEFMRFGQQLTWEDLQWAWNSEEGRKTSWISGEDALDYGGRIQNYITTKSKEKYSEYLGLRFNNTTSDVNEEITPAYQKSVEYEDGEFDKGLAINKIVKLNYNLIDLPKTFSLRFKFCNNYDTPKQLKILSLADESGNYCDIYRDNDKIIVERSDGISISGDYEPNSSFDYLNLMITQSDDKLILDYFIQYANVNNRIEVECEPLTNYTKIYFGRNK